MSAATRESYGRDDDLSVLYPDISQSKIMNICRDIGTGLINLFDIFEDVVNWNLIS